MKSRVHPKYKTQYGVANWPEYDRSLVHRGNLTVWLSRDAIARWNAKPSRRRGGQRKYADLAIETALTVRLLLHLPLRQTEGFLLSVFELMGIHLDVPDHTTLSRRSGHLDLPLRLRREPGRVDLVIDSSGLAILGEGEWAAVKHGGQGIQGWRKLHLGVDETGVIVAQALTDANTDDATTGIALVDQVTDDIDTVIGDSAYDTRPFYAEAAGRRAKVVVPPMKNARVGDKQSPVRNRAVRRIRRIGRRQWKSEAGYHRQARGENAFFRFKTMLGDRMRARGTDAQAVEARLACNILNQMTELGRPESYAIES
ncbi:MAG: IS5 family transposase [Planctomycetota bacterium]